MRNRINIKKFDYDWLKGDIISISEDKLIISDEVSGEKIMLKRLKSNIKLNEALELRKFIDSFSVREYEIFIMPEAGKKE